MQHIHVPFIATATRAGIVAAATGPGPGPGSGVRAGPRKEENNRYGLTDSAYWRAFICRTSSDEAVGLNPLDIFR